MPNARAGLCTQRSTSRAGATAASSFVTLSSVLNATEVEALANQCRSWPGLPLQAVVLDHDPSLHPLSPKSTAELTIEALQASAELAGECRLSVQVFFNCSASHWALTRRRLIDIAAHALQTPLLVTAPSVHHMASPQLVALAQNASAWWAQSQRACPARGAPVLRIPHGFIPPSSVRRITLGSALEAASTLSGSAAARPAPRRQIPSSPVHASLHGAPQRGRRGSHGGHGSIRTSRTYSPTTGAGLQEHQAQHAGDLSTLTAVFNMDVLDGRATQRRGVGGEGGIASDRAHEEGRQNGKSGLEPVSAGVGPSVAWPSWPGSQSNLRAQQRDVSGITPRALPAQPALSVAQRSEVVKGLGREQKGRQGAVGVASASGHAAVRRLHARLGLSQQGGAATEDQSDLLSDGHTTAIIECSSHAALASCYNGAAPGAAPAGATIDTFYNDTDIRLYLHRAFLSRRPSAVPLTVFAVITPSRLESYEAQCRAWSGPHVAVLYVPLVVHSALTSASTAILGGASSPLQTAPRSNVHLASGLGAAGPATNTAASTRNGGWVGAGVRGRAPGTVGAQDAGGSADLVAAMAQVRAQAAALAAARARLREATALAYASNVRKAGMASSGGAGQAGVAVAAASALEQAAVSLGLEEQGSAGLGNPRRRTLSQEGGGNHTSHPQDATRWHEEQVPGHDRDGPGPSIRSSLQRDRVLSQHLSGGVGHGRAVRASCKCGTDKDRLLQMLQGHSRCIRRCGPGPGPAGRRLQVAIVEPVPDVLGDSAPGPATQSGPRVSSLEADLPNARAASVGPEHGAAFFDLHHLHLGGHDRLRRVLDGVLVQAHQVFHRLDADPFACEPHIYVVVEVLDGPSLRSVLPINALRNLALLASQTRLVAMIDVDLMPSQAMRDIARDPRRVESLQWMMAQQPSVFVLPAFDVPHNASKVSVFHNAVAVSEALAGPTGSKASAQRLYSQHVIERFHQFVDLHRATDYVRWFESTVPYRVGYESGYEPWFISDRHTHLPYDERFRGYGANKQLQVRHMAMADFRFFVHPAAFVVHRPHQRSQAQDFYKAGEEARTHAAKSSAQLLHMLLRNGTLKMPAWRNMSAAERRTWWNEKNVEVRQRMYQPRNANEKVWVKVNDLATTIMTLAGKWLFSPRVSEPVLRCARSLAWWPEDSPARWTTAPNHPAALNSTTEARHLVW